MQMNEYCVACLLDKQLNNYPADAPRAQVADYQAAARAIIAGNMTLSAPENVELIEAEYRRCFGTMPDYSGIKRHFNALMLALEPEMTAAMEAAPDPLKRGLQIAMMGNFIDFAAQSSVDEVHLHRLIAEAGSNPVEPAALEALRRDVAAAKRLVYFTDNCGEIVADKVLVRALRRVNPAMEIAVIVRGAPVVNDATLEDAGQVGMAEVADRVMSNGSGIAGSVLARFSDEALAEARAADVLIAKGQGNYETLGGCGLNVYYVFMCKCQLFVDRFNVPQFSGLIKRELGA